eukprot:scaffold47_cov258-Pinguiococcus_pyrenoidosus.AAC.18
MLEVDGVAKIPVLSDEQVRHRQQLPVVRNEGESYLTVSIRARLLAVTAFSKEVDHDFTYRGDAGVQGGLQRKDELRNDVQDLVRAGANHVIHSVLGQECVRLLLFAKPVAEDGEVVVKVEGQDGNLPSDGVVDRAVDDLPAMHHLATVARLLCRERAATHLHGQITTLVESAEEGVRGILAGLRRQRSEGLRPSACCAAFEAGLHAFPDTRSRPESDIPASSAVAPQKVPRVPLLRVHGAAESILLREWQRRLQT